MGTERIVDVFPSDGKHLAKTTKRQPQRLFALNIAVHSSATRKTKLNNGESGSLARKGENVMKKYQFVFTDKNNNIITSMMIDANKSIDVNELGDDIANALAKQLTTVVTTSISGVIVNDQVEPVKEEPKFKVGELVRIRQWDDMAKEFGTADDDVILCESRFIKEMYPLCGLYAEIVGLNKDGRVGLKFFNCCGLNTGWEYSTDMLEKV